MEKCTLQFTEWCLLHKKTGDEVPIQILEGNWIQSLGCVLLFDHIWYKPSPVCPSVHEQVLLLYTQVASGIFFFTEMQVHVEFLMCKESILFQFSYLLLWHRRDQSGHVTVILLLFSERAGEHFYYNVPWFFLKYIGKNWQLSIHKCPRPLKSIMYLVAVPCASLETVTVLWHLLPFCGFSSLLMMMYST